MILLGSFKQIEGNKHKVGLIHYRPELLQDTSGGILVETLPKPLQQFDGKEAVLYVNIDTKEPFYEYEDVPKSEENEIGILKKQVAELSFLVMQLQGGTN